MSRPLGSDGKESACNVGDITLDLWAGKIPWRRKWQPTPVFWRIPWIEEPGGLQSSPCGRKESDMTE